MSKRSHNPKFLKHGFASIRSESGEKPQFVLCFQVFPSESLKEKSLRGTLFMPRKLKEKNLDFFIEKKMP